MTKREHILKQTFRILFIGLLFVVSFRIAFMIQGNGQAQNVVESLGVIGIIALSFLGSINIFVPFSVFPFLPIFIVSGIATPLIILGIVIGTTIGDTVTYIFGTLGKRYIASSKNRVVSFFVNCCHERRRLAELIVFLYSAFLPLPNGILLLPLGALGFKLRNLFLPYFLGTVLNITIVTYLFVWGFENIDSIIDVLTIL